MNRGHNSTRRPPDRRKNENCGGRGKKREILVPTPSGPLFLGFDPILFVPSPFVGCWCFFGVLWVFWGLLGQLRGTLWPQLITPEIGRSRIGRSRNWPNSKLAEVEFAHYRRNPSSSSSHPPRLEEDTPTHMRTHPKILHAATTRKRNTLNTCENTLWPILAKTKTPNLAKFGQNTKTQIVAKFGLIWPNSGHDRCKVFKEIWESMQDPLNLGEVNLNLNLSVGPFSEPAISHSPHVGSDPELYQLREHSMPKAPPKLTAVPSAPPASNSKAPLAVPNSSIPATSLSTETTVPTVTVPDCGGPQKERSRTNYH